MCAAEQMGVASGPYDHNVGILGCHGFLAVMQAMVQSSKASHPLNYYPYLRHSYLLRPCRTLYMPRCAAFGIGSPSDGAKRTRYGARYIHNL